MIDTVFGIKARMSGLCINWYRPIIGRLLDADYRLADNRPLPYQCISSSCYVTQAPTYNCFLVQAIPTAFFPPLLRLKAFHVRSSTP